MAKYRLLLLLALLLALCGAVASGILYSVHLQLSGGLAGACSEQGSACHAVLSSGWAYFPPVPSAGTLDPEHVRGRLPVAALGLAYFLGVFAWLCSLGRLAFLRRRLFVGLYAVVLAACIASVAFVALMMLRIGVLCPFCLVVHAVDLALLGVLFLARPREDAPPAPAPSASHVASALALSVLVACGAVLTGRGLAAEAEREVLAARLGQIQAEADLVELAHLAQDRFTKDEDATARFDAVLRPDDPQILPTAGAYGTLVYFSDLECPNCHRFELFLRDVIRPMFGSHLRIVFKHFPLEKLHANAVPAARALEAARLQGLFWELHDRLVERHAELDELDLAALAAEVGIDRERFDEAVRSEEVIRRVEDDIALGRSIGVDSTPAVFLDRRPVSGSVRMLAGFWRLRADALRRARETRGQPW